MHKPIGFLIQKKTLIPVNGIVHKFRSDWKKVAQYSDQQTHLIFKSISGEGPIETEAQFCKFLLATFGTGIYKMTAWKKGRKGFWSFLKVECKPDSFMRIPKKDTQEELEAKQSKSDYNKLKEKLNSAESEDERKQIEEEGQNILVDYDINKEIINADNQSTRRGPSPYLKATIPVYVEHDYELYGESSSSNSSSEYQERKQQVAGGWT